MKLRALLYLPALLTLGLAATPACIPVLAADKPAAAEKIPATRYFPLAIGNQWKYGYNRVTEVKMIAAQGENNEFSLKSDGVITSEVVRKDDERSGPNGEVFVTRLMEDGKVVVGGEPTDPSGPRLLSENYFRVNDRGIWLISDGEPDAQGKEVERVVDRRLPLLWVPADLRPDKSWTFTSQVDTHITARITSRSGKPRTMTVNGKSYENVIPVVSVAENLSGRLDMGVGLAPIRSGRMIDLTYYAPGIGPVRSHQVANFTLEPPNDNFTEARAHFEETQSLMPDYRVKE